MSSNYIDLPEEGGSSSGVSSLNSLTGALSLVAGSGITITPSGANITIAAPGGSGTVTSVSITSANGFAGTVLNPTTMPALTLTTTITGILKGNGTAISAATAGTDYVVPSGSITGTATNITAASNSTLTTLSSLSLPTSQLTGMLSPVNGGSPPTTHCLYVDIGRTDTYTADGSMARPFKTIQASINQIITNADNVTEPYVVIINPGSYSESLTFNNSLLYNLNFEALGATPTGEGGAVSLTGSPAISSTSNNTQLASLVFSGIQLGGGVTLTGDINNTNFGSTQILFNGCDFETSTGNVTFTNVNNINVYGGQFNGSGTITFNNIAFGYVEGAEGFHGGTLTLTQNNSGNQPSQSSGNYVLFSGTKCYAITSIDVGSELDAIQTYFGSTSVITNNGTLHSFSSSFNGTLTLNSGSSTRFRGDVLLNAPTVNAGATVTRQGILETSNVVTSALQLTTSPANGDFLKSDVVGNAAWQAGASLTETGSSVLTITGGSAALLAATTLQVKQASSSQNGYLSSTDWTTFNNKGSGSVTSVTFTGDGTVLSSTPSSAVTTSGTVTAALASQSINTVLAGPASGSSAAPTFRSLVTADFPVYQQNTTIRNAVTDGMTFSPSTNYTVTAYWSKVGPFMHLQGQAVLSGTGTASNVLIGIGSMTGGYLGASNPVIATAVMPGSTNTANATATYFDGASVGFNIAGAWNIMSNIYAGSNSFGFVSGGTRIMGSTWASGSSLNWNVWIPIVGWY
jgi:hypothetical protein